MRQYDHGGDVYAGQRIEHDFSVNINPLGMPSPVRAAVIAHLNEYETYPDSLCRALKNTISVHDGVKREQIVCGNGAADLIWRLCAALRPKQVLVSVPTFTEYERTAVHFGANIQQYPLNMAEHFPLTEQICSEITENTDLMFLCNPNNPTGRLIQPSVLASVAKRCHQTGTLLVVDECFLPFTEGISAQPLMEHNDRIVILRAFTKLYAMAGLRLGYLVSANDEVLDKTEREAQCWSVSGVAQSAGIAAMHCVGIAEKTRRVIAGERVFLTDGLMKLGFGVCPSEANFLLFTCEQPLKEPLLAKGILIRSCTDFVGLDERYYRVGIRLRAENEALLTALGEVLHG
ncbi:MAG: threonine-phosphate decarboxylase [Clostridia bacterium]